MKTYDSMLDFLNSIDNSTITGEIQTAFIKAWNKIHGYGGGACLLYTSDAADD